jgi:hypothetical protein
MGGSWALQLRGAVRRVKRGGNGTNARDLIRPPRFIVPRMKFAPAILLLALLGSAHGALDDSLKTLTAIGREGAGN